MYWEILISLKGNMISAFGSKGALVVQGWLLQYHYSRSSLGDEKGLKDP